MKSSDLQLRQDRRSQNAHRRAYEYNTGQTRLKSHPDVFAIESTNFCNLKCVMCPRGEPDIMDRHLGHMNDTVFHRIVDEWEFFTEPCWFHLFGEPLMHPRLFEQIDYAKQAGVPNLGISTNVTMLTKLKSAAILDSGLDTIILSIDGNDKETYEHIRKSPAFTYEEVCDNVREFLAMKKRFNKQRPHTILQIIVMEENKTQLEAFKAYWEGQGVNEVLFKLYTAWGNQAGDTFVDLAPTELRERFKDQPLVVRRFPCFYLWSSVVVLWDGRVVPCCFDFNAVSTMGDLNAQTLHEIWNGPQYVALRELELAQKNHTPLCAKCTEAPGWQRDPNAAEPVHGAAGAPLPSVVTAANFQPGI